VLRIPKDPSGFDRSLSARLLWRFSRERFDVVHTHNPIPLIYAAIPARLSGSRVVHSKHGPHPDAAHRLWLRRAGAAAAHVFCPVSEATAEFARSIYEVDRQKIRVVENGTDLDRYRPDPDARRRTRSALGLGDEVKVIGTVGRMEAVKNQALLIRAAAPLLGERVRLVIVGGGSLSAPTRALAEQLGVAPHCVFTGERHDTAELYRAFDVFALSSDSEGLPLVLTEAMGAALPIVATSVGGVPKVVDDAATGLLVPSGDEAALRSALERVLCDESLAARLGARGREAALERYAVGRMVDTYEAIYRS
jgi:glycosyltransferase involved in cell wall biosynthesis